MKVKGTNVLILKFFHQTESNYFPIIFFYLAYPPTCKNLKRKDRSPQAQGTKYSSLSRQFSKG